VLAEHGDCKAEGTAEYNLHMGFNKKEMENPRKDAADKEAAARRATERQILEDAERLIAAWNERQALRMPLLFAADNRRGDKRCRSVRRCLATRGRGRPN
jgi:hypothetical protein